MAGLAGGLRLGRVQWTDAVAANGAFRIRARVAVAYLSRSGRFFSFDRPSSLQLGLSLFHLLHSFPSPLSLFISLKMDELFDGAVGIDLGTTYS